MSLKNISETDHNFSSTKEYLIPLLKNHTLQISFVKKDGTDRVMQCTLRDDILPPHETNTSNPIDFPVTARPVDLKNLIVWDIEKLGFRKISLDTITSVNIIE